MINLNNIYYHINSYKKYNAGDIIGIGDDYNFMAKEMFNAKYFNSDGIDANEIMIQMKKNNNLTFNNEDFGVAKNTISNDSFVIRELIFEEIRVELFPNKPSRLKCLYLFKTLEENNEWESIFKRINRKPLQLLKLEVEGNIFEGDSSLILRQNNSIDDKVNQAKEYWSNTNAKIPEYLFTGKAKVIEIVKEY